VADVTRFAISNITWPADADDRAIDLVARAGYHGIELAPMKVFGKLDQCTQHHLSEYRRRVTDHGLEIVALQALLFGIEDCALFREDAQRRNLAEHLRRVAEIAGALGAVACVFGAPSVRDPGDLPADTVWRIATDFFTAIAPAFAESGSCLTFEANPNYYNCRFATHTEDAARLVAAVGHSGFRLQIDTGTIFINAEPVADLAHLIPLAEHFHVSERDLVPPGSASSDHLAVASLLRLSGYAGWRSVEMRCRPDWEDLICRVGQFVQATYQ
jgi:D-psicose/D-tagatose/L-ribulose 3-epimerase